MFKNIQGKAEGLVEWRGKAVIGRRGEAKKVDFLCRLCADNVPSLGPVGRRGPCRGNVQDEERRNGSHSGGGRTGSFG